MFRLFSELVLFGLGCGFLLLCLVLNIASFGGQAAAFAFFPTNKS